MRTLFLLATMPLFVAHLAMADNNFAVGNCKPRLKHFATIQTAVSSVPPGSTVQVCPGVYREQVTISQPLTLKGIPDSTLADLAVITVPSDGLTANVTSMFGESVAAQVLVQTSGGVNITNITVDGTGGDQACAIWLAGIFYASGSSGNVTRVRTSNQIDGGCGVGIWAENGGSSNQYVTIQGSSVHDVDGTGISLSSNTPPTLTVSVRNNFVSPSGSAVGIFATSVNGDITDNDVSTAVAGVFDLAPGVRLASNNVTSTEFGVALLAGGTVQSNDITNSGFGVVLGGPGAIVQSNRITLTTSAAVEFGCNTAIVSHNTINDAAVGLGDVPLGFSGSNTFANTGMISTDGCVAAAAAFSPLQAASPVAKPSSLLQWRTPANPLGSRP